MDSCASNRIEFLGNSCGQHGSYTFYRGIRYWKNGECHSLSLGEFFHARMNSIDQEIPLIGELQLVWEEKHHEGLKLSSVRLYILPEHCPSGRLPSHGQDEILAEDEKIVLRVEDLMKLVVLEPVLWSKGLLATQKICPQIDTSPSNNVAANGGSDGGGGGGDGGECREIGSRQPNEGTNVVILSYARYCRYRAALKRLEGCSNRWLAEFLIVAIGGFSTGATETRVMFCRSTVEHPVVESYEHRMNHLAPSLKGRRRKKRPKSKPNESEDSNESETNSEKCVLRCALTAEGVLGKRRPTEKLSEPNSSKSKGKKNLFLTEKVFLKRLHQYMNDRGTPIVRIPILGFKEVNLFQFFECTHQMGGYDSVTERRLWKVVYDQLGGSPGNTSAATGTRKNYEKLLLEFERHVQNRKKSVGINGKIKPIGLADDNDPPPPMSLGGQTDQTDQEIPTPMVEETLSPGNSSAPKTPEREHSEALAESVEARPASVGDTFEHVVQVEPVIQVSNKQRKLLRKTPNLSSSNMKKTIVSHRVEKLSCEDGEDVKAATDTRLSLSLSSDAEPKMSTVQVGDAHRPIDISPTSGKIASIIPCTVALEIITDKFGLKSEALMENNPDDLASSLKPEKAESTESERLYLGTDADRCLEDYLCSSGRISSPLPEQKRVVNRNDASPVVLTKKSQKSHPSSSVSETANKSKDGGSAGAKNLASTIEASSISRKLLSGGRAVVETAMLDSGDQSSNFLTSKLEPCLPRAASIKHVGNELTKSLLAHGFRDAIVSPFALGLGSPLIPTPPLVPINSSLSLSDNSSPRLEQTSSKVDDLIGLNIPFSFDAADRSNDDKLKTISGRCHSIGSATRSSPSPLLKKQLLSSLPKRGYPASTPPTESHPIAAKKYKSALESYTVGSINERSSQSHRSSVISSPIKRFIDGTTNWIPPPPDPNVAQNLPWTPADDQPTDLSMKTLLGQRKEMASPQDEPLDLSKSSASYRTGKSTTGAKPVVLPHCGVYVTTSPSALRNGNALPMSTSANTNKVAFVAPSMRSTPTFLPATSYPMSGLYSSSAVASPLSQSLHVMRPEQLTPLVAYAPSFHPAFQILSAPILSAIAAPGALLGSGSATSPRLAVPFFPVIPIAQGASSGLPVEKAPDVGNPFVPSVLKRTGKK